MVGVRWLRTAGEFGGPDEQGSGLLGDVEGVDFVVEDVAESGADLAPGAGAVVGFVVVAEEGEGDDGFVVGVGPGDELQDRLGTCARRFWDGADGVSLAVEDDGVAGLVFRGARFGHKVP